MNARARRPFSEIGVLASAELVDSPSSFTRFELQNDVEPAANPVEVRGLGAQLLTFDEDGRSAIDTLGPCPLNVSTNDLIDPVALHIVLELIDIQPQLPRIGNKDRARICQVYPGALITIKPVVHLLELILQARRDRRPRCRQSVLMNLSQGKKVKDDLQLLAILAFDLLEFRIKRTAGRTLIIAVLFEHYRRTYFDVRLLKTGRVRR